MIVHLHIQINSFIHLVKYVYIVAVLYFIVSKSNHKIIINFKTSKLLFGIDMLSAFGISNTMYDFFTIPAYEFDIELV